MPGGDDLARVVDQRFIGNHVGDTVGGHRTVLVDLQIKVDGDPLAVPLFAVVDTDIGVQHQVAHEQVPGPATARGGRR